MSHLLIMCQPLAHRDGEKSRLVESQPGMFRVGCSQMAGRRCFVGSKGSRKKMLCDKTSPFAEFGQHFDIWNIMKRVSILGFFSGTQCTHPSAILIVTCFFLVRGSNSFVAAFVSSYGTVAS